MNHYSQQPAQYQGQQQYSNANQSQFEPSGYVQSHYQGQLSFPSFGRENASITSNASHGGYSKHMGAQQHSAGAMQSYSQPAVSNHAYSSHQQVQSHAASPAMAFGNVGPVIAQLGYQAGQDASQHQQYGAQQQHQQYNQLHQQQQYSQQHQQQQYNQQYQPYAQQQSYNQPMGQSAQQSALGGYGQGAQSFGMSHGPVQSHTGQNPVYHATNAYQQAGPVISRVGWQSSSH